MLESQSFKPDTRLRYPVYDDRGVMLLNAGVVITPRLISLLDRRGIRLRLTASLVVTEGAQVGLEIPLTDTTTKIGRSKPCQIRPASRLVSGLHCAIDKHALALYVEDLKSTNGTYVNGERIAKPVELNDGDLIRFGDMTVRVALFAALEGDNEQVERVAGLILADEEDVDEPVGGATMALSEEEARRLARDLEHTDG